MYFLERKEPYSMPNVLGNKSYPVPTYRWKIIYTCADRKPLEYMLAAMDQETHRITSNNPEECLWEKRK